MNEKEEALLLLLTRTTEAENGQTEVPAKDNCVGFENPLA